MAQPEKWIAAANARLNGVPISLGLSGTKAVIYVRGVMPPQPWEQDQRARQRKVSLGRRALEEADVKLAEQVARSISLDLNRGQFDWLKFEQVVDPRPSGANTIGDWAAQFERERRSGMAAHTWHCNYELLMESLPLGQELTEVALIEWVLDRNPTANTMRAKYVTIGLALCELAEIPCNRLRKLRRDAPNKPLNPRKLPTDKQIEAMHRQISEERPGWAWVYGMLATYGLRPHEIFRLEFDQWPDVIVGENSKTGERTVPPIHPKWVELFGLDGRSRIPELLEWSPEQSNTRLGRKVGGGFKGHGFGDPYDLRHCYARRCLTKGMTSDIACRLMGHSRDVHEQKYRAWITSSVYLDAAKRVIDEG
jgi:integrase